MIKLINETPDIHKPFTGIEKIEITIGEEASLTELLEAFKLFLQAGGYTINGILDVVEEDS